MANIYETYVITMWSPYSGTEMYNSELYSSFALADVDKAKAEHDLMATSLGRSSDIRFHITTLDNFIITQCSESRLSGQQSANTYIS